MRVKHNLTSTVRSAVTSIRLERFTIDDVCAHLLKHYHMVTSSRQRNQVSSTLSELVKQGQLRVVGTGTADAGGVSYGSAMRVFERVERGDPQ